MVKEVDVGRKKWVGLQKKTRQSSRGRKRGALRRAISGRLWPRFRQGVFCRVPTARVPCHSA